MNRFGVAGGRRKVPPTKPPLKEPPVEEHPGVKQAEMPILENIMGPQMNTLLKAFKLFQKMTGEKAQTQVPALPTGKTGATGTMHGGQPLGSDQGTSAAAAASTGMNDTPDNDGTSVVSLAFNPNTTGAYFVNTESKWHNRMDDNNPSTVQIIEHVAVIVRIGANQTVGRGTFKFEIADLADQDTLRNFRLWSTYNPKHQRMLLPNEQKFNPAQLHLLTEYS